MVATLLFYGAMFCVNAYINARLQNIVWRKTTLGAVGFDSAVRARKLARITIVNFLMIIVTFGLFIPFAAVRLARYRIESMTLLVDGDLEHFMAQSQQQIGAAGEGAADLFDIDIAV